MTHTIESTVKYVWHDLTENPNDVPNDNEYCLTVLRNKKTGELGTSFFNYFDYNSMAMYVSDLKIWECTEDDGYGSFDKVTMNSYGIESTEETTADWEVVAWAEDLSQKIPVYVPALFSTVKEGETK